MNILIIGNGFDLAHGLQTKYTDFLKYCNDYDKKNPICESEELSEEFSLLIKDNIWLKYFLGMVDLKNLETWIDFEKEISVLIQRMELPSFSIEQGFYLNAPQEVMLNYSEYTEEFEKFIGLLGNYDWEKKALILENDNIKDVDALVNYIYLQLRDFSRAFEIYCLKINETEIVEPIVSYERKEKIEKAESDKTYYMNQARNAGGYVHLRDKIPEYERLRDQASQLYSSLLEEVSPIDYLGMSEFDCVLSFNYTNTYERLYGNDKTQYCYIHGKAQENRDSMNIILGVDDALRHGEESQNFRCVKFKKYFQRILFKTGSEYKDWLVLGQKQNTFTNYVYIVGHSIDRTDYEILYEFFSANTFKIIVYYYSPKDFEEKVKSVIQLLSYKGKNGRDELIQRVHGKNWSIKFVNQYDEINGLFIRQ